MSLITESLSRKEKAMIKRVALGLVFMVGAFWLISTFALGYPAKTQAVDNLTNSFRPVFTNAGERQAKADITTVDSFAAGFQGQAVPALARQLKMTPDQLIAALGKQYPAVGTGVQQLPTILPYFNHLVDGLQAQQSNFQQADAIPAKNLPATTVHWLFVILGAVTIALAGLGLFRPRLAGAALVVAGVFGIVVIAVTLILSVPAKTQAVDNMTNAFRPVFTTQGAAQTRQYLQTVEAMDTQLNNQALPGLAGLLKVTPAQLDRSLGTSFPAVATGLKQLPAILGRFNVLVTKIQDNVTNFQQADSIPTKGTPTTLLQAQLAVPAGALIVAGLFGAAVPTMQRASRKNSAALASHQRTLAPAP